MHKINFFPIRNMNFNSLKKPLIFNYIFLLFLTLSSIAIFVPLNPAMPSRGLDPSWILGMNQALEQNLILGKELIFTFGPYASLYTSAFHPATHLLMLFTSFYLTSVFILLSAKILKNYNYFVKFIYFLILFFVFTQRDSFYFIYCLLLTTYIFNQSITKNKTTENNHLTLALLFSILGLLPLIKGTAIISSLASVILSSLILFKDKNFKSILILIISPIITMVLLWSISGQSISNISIYFISIIEIIKGYSNAMSIEGNISEVIFYIASSLFILINFLLNFKNNFYLNTLLACSFSISLFLGFKAGFVRHDGHAIIAGNVLLATACVTLLIEGKYLKYKIFSIIFATFVFVFIQNSYQSYKLENISKVITNPFKNSYLGIKNRLKDINHYSNSYTQTTKKLATEGQIGLFSGSTDIYNYNQTDLITTNNKWNPRPIFQSYSAYTPKLLNLNREHLLSKKRPDNIVFNLETIDGRFPSLEDGASWPILLNSYDLVENKNSYLLFKHKNNSPIFKEETIFSSTLQFNKEIFIPNHSDFLYARINFNPTILGKILNLIYKPTQLIIKIRLNNGEIKSYRLISGMSETNFLISHLTENNQDFKDLYTNQNNRKITSIMFEAPKGSLFWRNNFEINFVKITP